MSEIRLINKVVYGLERCPQCGVSTPLISLWGQAAKHFADAWDNTWYHFTGVCSKCTRHILFYGMGGSNPDDIQVTQTFPKLDRVAEELPEMAGKFLQQAIESRHAPDGALMLSASSIDAMLKHIGYTEGSLYSRVDTAKDDGVITERMADWAHTIRLSANEPRHADDDFKGATEEDAEQSLAFAKALGEYLFVLPAKVARWKSRAEATTEAD